MYATGVPNTLAITLQDLATFAAANGWAIDENDARAGFDWIVSIHKGTCYLSFYIRTGSNVLTLNGATAFAGGIDPQAQANAYPIANAPVTVDAVIGPFVGYHLFTAASTSPNAYMYLVIEVSAGVFRCIFTGQLPNVSGALPGIFIAATNWYAATPYKSYPDYANTNFIPFSAVSSNTAVLVEVDGVMQWFCLNFPVGKRTGYLPVQSSGFQNGGFSRSPNTFNGLAPYFPCGLFVERAVGNLWSYAGSAPDLGYLNIANNNPKDEVALGGDTWKIFPACAKGITTNVYNAPYFSSGNYGFALRKNG
jgi:hypothetical protein